MEQGIINAIQWKTPQRILECWYHLRKILKPGFQSTGVSQSTSKFMWTVFMIFSTQEFKENFMNSLTDNWSQALVEYNNKHFGHQFKLYRDTAASMGPKIPKINSRYRPGIAVYCIYLSISMCPCRQGLFNFS